MVTYSKANYTEIDGDFLNNYRGQEIHPKSFIPRKAS